ncbi:DUF5753 domain-containing protein [Nocardia sp. NBC_01009]|nr:DUF5753 domain-containing protein [Nocardia sp. NBC_01009]
MPTKLNPLFLKRLCELYEVGDEQRAVVLTLAEESRKRGWWHTFDDAIPKTFGLFVGLEDAAHRIVSFQTTLLPGLLHTRAYRRALIWTEYPNMPTNDVEIAVEIGMRRQARLNSGSNLLTLDVYVDESALRRLTGSAELMADQMRHLADVGQLPNVSVRVIPALTGTYRAVVVGAFVLLEFPPHPTAYLTEPPVVYVQGFTGDLYLERPEEIETYREVCTDLRRLSLDEAESRALILEIAEEYAA